jgi:hypothetical protein
MSKVVYQVTLSPDGKHAVSVRSDDPLSLKEALPLAKQLQERLLGSPELQPPTPISQPLPQEPDLEQPQAPRCGVHGTPMARMQGRRGPFWSCHQKNLDGSWCTFRPGRPQTEATPPAYSFPTV